MKKSVAICVFIVVLAAAISFFIFEYFSINKKTSFAEDVEFKISHSTLYSGKNLNGEFNEYTLQITIAEEKFLQPVLNHSENVKVVSKQIYPQQIVITFNIISGTKIVFSFATENHLELSKSYATKENETNLKCSFLSVYTNKEIPLAKQGEKLVFYYVDKENQRLNAENAGFVSEFKINFLFNELALDAENLLLDLSGNIIYNNGILSSNGWGLGELSVKLKNPNIEALEIEFVIKRIEPERVETLNSNIVLDLFNNVSAPLKLKILPEYANEPIFNFDEFVEIENGFINGVKVGEGTVCWKTETLLSYVVINSALVEETVNINKEYTYTITSANNEIEIFQHNNITILNLNSFNNEIVLDVVITLDDNLIRLCNQVFILADKLGLLAVEPTFLTSTKLSVVFSENAVALIAAANAAMASNIPEAAAGFAPEDAKGQIIIGLSISQSLEMPVLNHIIIINFC